MEQEVGSFANSIYVVISAICILITAVWKIINDKRRYTLRMKSEQKRHSEITKHQKSRNRMAAEQSIKMDALQEAIEMSNGFTCASRVGEIKYMAFGDQKLYFIKELYTLYEHNGLVSHKEETMINISVLISKTITKTDAALKKVIPERYLAPTDDKIKFLLAHKFDVRIYSSLLSTKETPHLLFERASRLYDNALGIIKTEFYNNDGELKLNRDRRD